MKKSFLIIIVTAGFFYCHGQTNVTDQASGYLFENFSKGQVLLKSGVIEAALLNYNTTDQSIVFEKDGKTMILTGLETIDTIQFRNKKFIPGPDGLIYEVLLNDVPPVSLYVTYSNKKKPATAVADQSGTSHKESAEVSNTMSSVYVLRPYSGDYMVAIKRNFWLIKSKQIFKATSERQFNKVFPHKEEAIKTYISDNKVNFDIEDDLIKLTAFCNGRS